VAADCRSLVEVPEYDWAGDAAKEFLPAIQLKRRAHAGVVDLVDRDAATLRSQDLATAKLANPLAKRQARLRMARAFLEVHEATLPYLERLLPEAEARYQKALEAAPPVRKRIDDGLVELGFAPGLDPRIYTRNRLLSDVKNAATFAGVQKDQLLAKRKECQERIEAAKGEIACVEEEIRAALT